MKPIKQRSAPCRIGVLVLLVCLGWMQTAHAQAGEVAVNPMWFLIGGGEVQGTVFLGKHLSVGVNYIWITDSVTVSGIKPDSSEITMYLARVYQDASDDGWLLAGGLGTLKHQFNGIDDYSVTKTDSTGLYGAGYRWMFSNNQLSFSLEKLFGRMQVSVNDDEVEGETVVDSPLLLLLGVVF